MSDMFSVREMITKSDIVSERDDSSSLLFEQAAPVFTQFLQSIGEDAVGSIQIMQNPSIHNPGNVSPELGSVKEQPGVKPDVPSSGYVPGIEVGNPVMVGRGVLYGMGVTVEVIVAVMVANGVDVVCGLFGSYPVPVGDGSGVCVVVSVGLGDICGVSVGFVVGVSEGLGVGSVFCVGLGCAVGVGCWLGYGVGCGDGYGVGCGDGYGVAVCGAVGDGWGVISGYAVLQIMYLSISRNVYACQSA